MITKKIFIIVPSAKLESPVKGAIALANELIKFYPIVFITIKRGKSDLNSLNKKVEYIKLHEKGNFFKRFIFLKSLIGDDSKSNSIASISIGLSADFLNSVMFNSAITVSSVRGNLPKVYRNNYGIIGRYIAYFHLIRLKKLDHVISMTKSMSQMVETYILKKSPIIGNFIDESSLDIYRRKISNKNEYRFIYCGSLINGKQPEVAIISMSELIKKGMKARLDIFGDGPLINYLKELSLNLNLNKIVFFHGHILSPFDEIAKADVMLIPSISEGVSRAALESLYLGVPCIMRDIDGNSELITPNVNGQLFSNNNDLSQIMVETAINSRKRKMYESILIPSSFRQSIASKKYINIINKDL
jgi:glycosyltransferase involved in cell wall biosynthesis